MKQFLLLLIIPLLFSCSNEAKQTKEKKIVPVKHSPSFLEKENVTASAQNKKKLNPMVVYSDVMSIYLDSSDLSASIITKHFGDTLFFWNPHNCECCYFPEDIHVNNVQLFKVYLTDSTYGFVKNAHDFAVNTKIYEIKEYKILQSEGCSHGQKYFDNPILLKNDSVIRRFGSLDSYTSELIFDSLVFFHHGRGLSIINPFTESLNDIIKSYSIYAYKIESLKDKIVFLQGPDKAQNYISVKEYDIKTDSIQSIFDIPADTLDVGVDGGEAYYYGFKMKSFGEANQYSFWITIKDSVNTQKYITVDEFGSIIEINDRE